ncbi:MAG: IclR family transcriptional regulator [Alphaproteobacteria bacterium]|nr:IclR family transcriptional regulator [Alphaproteobacteria bacterium]
MKSAERALDILELMALRDESLTLSEISRYLELPKSSASMLLRTLEARGYLGREPGAGYRLNPVFRESRIGWIGGAVALLTRISRPVMLDLRDELGETTVLGVLDAEHETRILRHFVSPQAVRYDLGDTTVLPTYCSALGQAMMAYSPVEIVDDYLSRTRMTALTEHTLRTRKAFRKRLVEIRRQGYSVNLDERVPGASGAAVAIFGPGEQVVAALNVSTVTFRFLQSRETIIAALRQSAGRITELLGGTPLALPPSEVVQMKKTVGRVG